MHRRFATLDVFTTTPLAGNPLAVVLDAQGLSDVRMQAIAAEFNLSETVFVLPPADPHHRAALRIFTPARELPFAGHPTVGTAVLLALNDRADAGMAGAHGHLAFDLEERIGLVACDVEVLNRDTGQATFTLPKLSQHIGPVADGDAIAQALGVAAAAIGYGAHVPAVWSAGVPFALVPLATRAACDAVTIDQAAFVRAFGAVGACFVYCPEAIAPDAAIHARMFAPLMGIAEDPATGSAVAAFSGAYAAAEALRDGDHAIIIEQGFRMGRPSRIALSLTVADGVVARAAIGGAAVVVSTGVLTL